MPFKLLFSDRAAAELEHIEKTDAKKHKRVKKALGLLEANPKHPSLQTHEYDSIWGPKGEKAFEAYVENKTPAAWRIFFCYPAGKRGTIFVLAITPHP